MSQHIPSVGKFMTYDPMFIEASATIENAQKLMKQHHIRHLPVVDGGKVSGILSDRDVKLALGAVGGSPERLKVDDIAHRQVYKVPAATPIDQVCSQMASKQYGCAVIEENGRLVGIFTTVDALKAVVELCHQRYHTT